MSGSGRSAPDEAQQQSASAGGFSVFVINLDRSPDRLARVVASAERLQIRIERVAGVEGAALDLISHADLDPATFSKVNGRPMLPGEAGCYLSHLKAIETFLAGNAPMALICEDDVEFTADTVPFLNELSLVDGWDVVKLYSSRTYGFQKYLQMDSGHSIGRCLAGPVGCAAAYAVSRDGAVRLLAALRPMIIPYDVALERGWKGTIGFYLIDRQVVRLQSSQPSTITSMGSYGRTKYPFYRRVGTLAFRTSEYVKRVKFALSGSRLRKRLL